MITLSDSEEKGRKGNYSAVKNDIHNGSIFRFDQLLNYISSVELAELLGVDLGGIILLMRQPEVVNFGQIGNLADAFEVSYQEIVQVMTGRILLKKMNK